MLRKSDYQNISNYFKETDDVPADLNEVMSRVVDSLFGVEIERIGAATIKRIVAPPYARLRDSSPLRLTEVDIGSFTHYEGYLSRPHFLPLYVNLEGCLIEELEKMELDETEIVCIQLLLRRKKEWKERALQMYANWLEGVNSPFSSYIGREVQYKVLSTLSRVFPLTPNGYLDEVEEKLLSEGFQFQLRIAIQSDNPTSLVKKIKSIFVKYDSHNKLELYRTKDKRFTGLYNTCVITADTDLQILSREELSSLLGIEVPEIQKVNYTPAQVQSRPKPQVSSTGLIELLPRYEREEVQVDERIVSHVAEALKRVGIIQQARIHNETVIAGIRLTIVQFSIPKGKTITQIESRLKDIKAALGISELAIEQGDTPDTVRFLVPNETPTIVSLRELVSTKEFRKFAYENPLGFVVGVDEIGKPIYLSLVKLVHLLVAGTTGSGKSVFINSLIVSLLVNYTPTQLRFLMIDPKQVELTQYVDLPHVDDVITEMDKAYVALERLVKEMENRYRLFKERGVKNIMLYNQKEDTAVMPYIVCVIDEYADLQGQFKEVEQCVQRLGQKARAAGIHLVLATQRPDSNVISGTVKAVIPNAISFKLNTSKDYGTVFGSGIGGINLLGRGDGIMKIEGYKKAFQRFQSAMLNPDESKEEEVYKSIVSYFESYDKPTEGLGDMSEQVTEKEEPVCLYQEEEDKDKDEIEPIAIVEPEDDNLYKLKQIIASTRETKVEALRQKLGVKTAKMKVLMETLVNEGWLFKHKERSKGYELIASEDTLSEWRE